jgi:hypothetical protein
MSLDLQKVKKILDKYHITPLEYFCVDNECMLIKAFLNRNAEYLLIYISSKHRFGVGSESKNIVFDIEEIEDSTESDDYSKSTKVPDMENIEVDKSVNTYTELTRKYQKNIMLEGPDEPVQRKIKRQIERIKIPFSRLSYDVALQNNKWVCIAFGEDVSLFKIKGDYFSKSRIFYYLVSLSDMIEKVEDIQDEVKIIGEQFYDIIGKVSISNMENMASEIDNYPVIMASIAKKKEDYKKSVEGYQKMYDDTIEKESTFVKQYKAQMAVIEKEPQSLLKKSALEAKSQKMYEGIYQERKEIVRKGVDLIESFHRHLFILEEVSFDNSIMVTRVNKNFTLLKNTF